MVAGRSCLSSAARFGGVVALKAAVDPRVKSAAGGVVIGVFPRQPLKCRVVCSGCEVSPTKWLRMPMR